MVLNPDPSNGTSYIVQIAKSVVPDDNFLFVRTYNGMVWSGWLKITGAFVS